MAIKPPALLLPFSPLCSSHITTTHCPRSTSSTSSPSTSQCQRFSRRRYATTSSSSPSPPPEKKWSDSSPSPDEAAHEWPKSPRPTPYEVLGISNKAAAYDKRRFYHLVKLYHPDTHDHHHHHNHHNHNPPSSSPAAAAASVKSLPPATRLERYRMIVAANELLSNPPKRRMYDTHGVGWSHGDHPAPLRDIDRSWRHQPGSAANNATWEDWERWREAQQGGGKSGEPVYMSHGAFASIVVLMCLVGAMAQTNRAEASGAQYVGWADQHSADIGGRLRRNGSAVAGLSKDERVDYFLRERENVNYQFVPSKHEETDPSRPT
ncbi:hypothetical protein HDV57DRAFT_484151 [Trichoderma longibrachiatum]|uniref:J domain-containing protein n=1 Tax=Trichoderma longibrachiatum ATCC 18648 TaxID=983965 RepID=A0A2T4C788_TRILO|nr:hypothetical protein M440DRAFT_1400347 [Trichoderma longibrachiatum ATCC 18648]